MQQSVIFNIVHKVFDFTTIDFVTTPLFSEMSCIMPVFSIGCVLSDQLYRLTVISKMEGTVWKSLKSQRVG